MTEQFILVTERGYIKKQDNKYYFTGIAHAKVFDNIKTANDTAKELLEKYEINECDIISIKFKTLKQYRKRTEIICLDK